MNLSTELFLWNEHGSPARYNALAKLLVSLDVEEHHDPRGANPYVTDLCKRAMREASMAPQLTDALMDNFNDALRAPDEYNELLDKAGQRYERTSMMPAFTARRVLRSKHTLHTLCRIPTHAHNCAPIQRNSQGPAGLDPQRISDMCARKRGRVYKNHFA